MNADDGNAKIEMKRCSILNMHNSDARHSFIQSGKTRTGRKCLRSTSRT